ncbi:hypothetical protein IAU60_001968 [Kwoniella sp. DSM 27419]
MAVKPLEDGSDRTIDARSIVSLIVFFIVNALVIWPVRIPLPMFVTRIWAGARAKLGLRPEGSTRQDASSEAPREGQSLADAERAEPHQTVGAGQAPDTADAGSATPDGTVVEQTAQLPRTQPLKRLYFPLDLRTSPVIGVLLLLASTCIPGAVVRRGIVGSAGVKPYDIMTLFICFAYISISLDATGLLRYLAFLVASKSTSSGGGKTLYNAFYLFFAIVGLIFGNDPLILSGTPFLAYFTDHASISPPTAFLFTHFQVSNLVSALLVSSNPTNLVLTSAFGISFLSYSAWLALPTVAAVVLLYPLLRWALFGRKGLIPATIHPPTINPRDALLDPFGAAFGAIIFIITIVVLIVLSAVHLLEGTEGVWTVTAPAAALVLLRDLASDWKRGKRPTASSQEKTPKALDEKETQLQAAPTPDTQDGGATVHSPSKPGPPRDRRHTLLSPAFAFARRFPTTTQIISHLPIPLLPFAFSFFILVEGLQHTGWIRVFGGWWAAWMEVGGVAGGVWLMGMLSVIGCNVFGTNIGATILLARVLQYWATTRAVSDRELYGAVFTLAVGSNFGAYSFVFSASLAGLLWRTILGQKSITLSMREFAQWNVFPVILTMIVGCLVVAGEVCVMYKG